LSFTSTLVYYLLSRLGAYPKSGVSERTPLGSQLHSALPTNIRLGWKGLTVTNALAYCGTELITAVKSFIVPGGSKTPRNLLDEAKST